MTDARHVSDEQYARISKKLERAQELREKDYRSTKTASSHAG